MRKGLLLGSLLFFLGCNQVNNPQPKNIKQEIKIKKVHKLTLKEIKAKKDAKLKKSINQEFLKRLDSLAQKDNITKQISLYRDKENFVIDPKNNLMWQDNKDVTKNQQNWNDSVNYCRNLEFAGYKGWKVPTKEQLFSIVDKKYYPSIKTIFKNVRLGSYWTSSNVENKINSKFYINFDYGEVGEANINEKMFVRCVRNSKVLTFTTKKNICLYEAIEGNNDTFYIFRDKTGKFDKFIYFKYPFLEVNGFTEALFDLWYKPRKIEKPKLIKEIKKPVLPSKIVAIKSEYETEKMFKNREIKLEKDRRIKLQKLQKEYIKAVNKRNVKLQQQMDKYLIQLQEVKEEQKYKNIMKDSKLKEFRKIVFKTIMGDLFFVKNNYNAEKQIMFVTMKSNRANYEIKLEIKIPINEARDFAQNIDEVKIKPIFKISDKKIILTHITINFNGNIYQGEIKKQNFQLQDRYLGLRDGQDLIIPLNGDYSNDKGFL